MSNDLISRSALLEEINNFSMRITGSANAMAIAIMEETKKSIAKLIDEQSTAYNVDKVVDQLGKLVNAEYEKEANCDENGFGDGEQIYEDGRTRGMYEAYGKALEIVKSGGIE